MENHLCGFSGSDSADKDGAGAGDSTGDSTVGGTGDTSPGALGSRVTERPGMSP